MKKFTTILIESLVIGLIAVIYFFILNLIVPKNILSLNDTNRTLLLIFLSGGLVHLVFEYTGLNKKYVDNYYKN